MQKEIQTTKLTRIGLWMVAAGFFVWLLDYIDSLLGAFVHLNTLTYRILIDVVFGGLFPLGFALISTIKPGGWLRFSSIVLAVVFFIRCTLLDIYGLLNPSIYELWWDRFGWNVMDIVHCAFVAIYTSALILFGLSCMFFAKKHAKVFAFISGFFWVWWGFANMFYVFFIGLAPTRDVYRGEELIYNYHDILKLIENVAYIFGMCAFLATGIFFIVLIQISARAEKKAIAE